MLRERYLLPGQKPDRVMVWRPAVVPPPDHAYLMLPCEHGANTIVDYTSRASRAYTVNSPLWLGDRWLLDNGANQYIILPHRPVANGGTCTVAIVFSCASTDAWQTLWSEGYNGIAPFADIKVFRYGDTMEFLIRDDTNTTFCGRTSAIAYASGYLTDGRLHVAIAGTVGPSRAWYAQLDSRYYASGTCSPTPPTLLDRTAVGAFRRDSVEQYHDGSIAAVMVWRRALTRSQRDAIVADPYMWFREPRRVRLPGELEAPANWYIPNKMHAFRDRRAAL